MAKDEAPEPRNRRADAGSAETLGSAEQRRNGTSENKNGSLGMILALRDMREVRYWDVWIKSS